ncbi:Response regulator rcp1 [Pirellula sp. SH-Sr6A]|uniref:response regulator n=1 Tax=Pirellula sp. SH-Sr6A TaxID=1632865 RepID=UPI00078BC6D4|nr:response regulator [Pirellula sp. SH-Sr6A]AMV31383.1 Response regulator rcp1 [Pirellula sp. SH-Sr6A]
MSFEDDRRAVEILLVEDSPSDALLTREAFGMTSIQNRLHLAMDGVEAMAFLRKQGVYNTSPTPDLILLDLNLPRKGGHEVLSEIKGDSGLCSIPVVVLTTSQRRADVSRAYELHANCYVVKPVDFLAFVDVIRSIQTFWFTVALIPELGK